MILQHQDFLILQGIVAYHQVILSSFEKGFWQHPHIVQDFRHIQMPTSFYQLTHQTPVVTWKIF